MRRCDTNFKVVTLKHLLSVLLYGIILTQPLIAQIVLSGRVLDEVNKKPIVLGTIIILEAKIKKRITDGTYSITLPKPGVYTIIINALGMSKLRKKIRVDQKKQLNFYLELSKTRTKVLKVRGRQDIQVLSRNTLNQEELKQAPATFGDSLNALTTLPGIIRSTASGFFGSLIIRGANEFDNRYYIDDIPVLYPQHFGAIQSVISNELISRIDLYSSSASAAYGQSLGGVIDIHTQDNVQDLNVKAIIGFISSDFYLETAITDKDNSISSAAPQVSDEKARGYWITSGRVSYLTSILGPILSATSSSNSRTTFQLPQYYDYQLKGRYFLDVEGKHQVKLLFFGFYDTFEIISRAATQTEANDAVNNGSDPLLANSASEISNSVLSNNLGVYYTYQPSKKLSENLVIFSAWNNSRFFSTVQRVSRTIDLKIKPNLYGIKNTVEWNWWEDYSFLKWGFSVISYHFTSEGTAQAPTRVIPSSGGPPDLGDNTLFKAVPVNFSRTNVLLSSFFENPLEFLNFKIIPGIRLAYLNLSREFTYDPRVLISYEFIWGMTLSSSYGLYSSYPQLNYFRFNQPFNQQPDIARSSNLQAEKAHHASAGFEQLFGLFSVKLEGYYNTFMDQLIQNPNPQAANTFINASNTISYGVELLLKLDRAEQQNAFYGWASYTFNESNNKTNLPDGSGGQYKNSQFEQPHSLKIVSGYKWGKHHFGARFSLSSGFPYTSIVGSTRQDIGQIKRYQPNYGALLSRRFAINHRLDLRYSYTSTFKWGNINWFIEVINVYYAQPVTNQSWNYNRAFQADGSNPSFVQDPTSLPIPNFGVEMNF